MGLNNFYNTPNPEFIKDHNAQLQNEPNQFMKEIVENLDAVRAAQSSARILPMQLTDLMKPFNQDYFLYWGSLITIHNIHRILWVTSRVPIGISPEQVNSCNSLFNYFYYFSRRLKNIWYSQHYL